ncbi:GOLPH3/VPS74 family protein [Yinghuangia seranimata]|uniref:GOLPH3/VPS74 family protein n=1 Tax=Yinghuangia seranimata TaxID=408067 RepID=UPI00248B1A1F|nr:GPP34 family phosphoprotein [Yinghuangia seranimata]MDI2129806.1 GPP34 family phosphoprotein [Yinghuangia seranimata]
MPARSDEPTLTQRVLLLAYRADKERISGGSHLGVTLQAVALQSLLDQGLVSDERGKVVAEGGRRAAAQDALEAALYTRITESRRPRSWQHWVKTREHTAKQLVRTDAAEAGLIKLTEARMLGIFPYTRAKLRQPAPRRAAADAIRDALRATTPVARVPRDAAVLAVLVHHGELPTVTTFSERRANRARIDELAARLGSPVPEALRKAVRDEKASHGGG